MDTWLENPARRSLLLGSASVMVWLIPLCFHGPRLLRLLSYPVAVTCCVQAVRETFEWEQMDQRSVKQQKIADYLEDAEMLLQAKQIEEGMEEAFARPFQGDPEEAESAEILQKEFSSSSQQRSLEAASPIRKIERLIGQSGIDLYLYLQSSGGDMVQADGTFNIRELQKRWKRLDTEQLNLLLEQFAAAGLGGFGARGRAKLFRLNL